MKSLYGCCRFTFLHAPKDMHSKNVEALRTLLDLCNSEPNTLQDTWNAVLECISRLEYITSTPPMAAAIMHGANQISRDAVVQSLKELAGKPCDQVFLISVKLPSESVVEFFTALCNISREELKQIPARVYSLQKLVEISYHNMARIRMVIIPLPCSRQQYGRVGYRVKLVIFVTSWVELTRKHFFSILKVFIHNQCAKYDH